MSKHDYSHLSDLDIELLGHLDAVSDNWPREELKRNEHYRRGWIAGTSKNERLRSAHSDSQSLQKFKEFAELSDYAREKKLKEDIEEIFKLHDVMIARQNLPPKQAEELKKLGYRAGVTGGKCDTELWDKYFIYKKAYLMGLEDRRIANKN